MNQHRSTGNQNIENCLCQTDSIDFVVNACEATRQPVKRSSMNMWAGKGQLNLDRDPVEFAHGVFFFFVCVCKTTGEKR